MAPTQEVVHTTELESRSSIASRAKQVITLSDTDTKIYLYSVTTRLVKSNGVNEALRYLHF